MDPTKSQWQQIKALFQASLERGAADRAAFVQQAAPGDDNQSLRAEVMQLLRLHDDSPGFLQTPIDPSGDEVCGGSGGSGSDPLLGRRLDGFVIVRRIGAGGMGAVYEARQEHPARRAAIKVMRPGFVSRETLRRFEYESEILAKLQHPNIAHIYAAGTFDLGDGAQPWFAMELIEGEPLNVFVNAREGRQLSTTQKLQLMLRICDAVQHAHQRGVIHRDLKPANILVAQPSAGDAEPIPKIVDFGVARTTDADAAVTMHTAAGDLVGTLSYMSPEQLSGDPHRIDARADIYALGVIGYELLSRRLPHERKSSSVAEVIRAIEREEPRRLGVVDPALRGDLERIFAKALDKDPARRYQSAAELSADLQRYLNHEPVLARPATALYQLRKFARRNRALVGGTIATMTALVVGLVLYAVKAQQASAAAKQSQYEADKATAINNFITNDFLMKLLAAANAPPVNEGGGVAQRLPVAELVDQAAGNIESMFSGQPLAEAAVRNEVATIYYNLGAFDKAHDQFALALERWESNLGPDHPDTLKAVNNLGQTLAHLRRGPEAEALYRRALDGRVRVLGEDDPYTLVTMNNLGSLLRSTGKLDEAEAILARALQVQRRVHGPTHKNTLTSMANLGSLLLDRGRIDEGLDLHRQTYEGSRATLGEDHLMTLIAGSRLAQTLHKAGQAEEAAALLERILALMIQAVGPDHNSTITVRRTMARVYKTLGRPHDRTAQLELALASARQTGQEHLVDEIQDDLAEGASPAP